ncbi:MAG: hypothetical protein AAAB17_11255, partial [Pseudomonas sp.]
TVQYTTQIPCGSGGAAIRLAREGGVSGNIIVDWESVFASKPAPTGFVTGIAYARAENMC